MEAILDRMTAAVAAANFISANKGKGDVDECFAESGTRGVGHFISDHRSHCNKAGLSRRRHYWRMAALRENTRAGMTIVACI